MSNPERLKSINRKVVAPRPTIDTVQHLNLHAWLQIAAVASGFWTDDYLHLGSVVCMAVRNCSVFF